MQFKRIFPQSIEELSISENWYRPNLPVSPLAGTDLTINYDNLELQITATGGQADIIGILTGILYYVGPNKLELWLSKLDDDGYPQPIFGLFGILHILNPQLMLLPAVIHYEFPFTAQSLRNRLTEYIDETHVPGIPDLTKAVDRKGRSIGFTSTDRLLDRFLNPDERVGIWIRGGEVLGRVSNGEQVNLRAKDFKNYTAVDRSIAVIDLPQGTNIPRNRIQHVYKVEDCDGNLDPIPIQTPNGPVNPIDYEANIISFGNQYKIDHSDFNSEIAVIIHYLENNTIQKQKFDLDGFEKWSLFDSNLSWHFKNWYVSGFLREPDKRNPHLMPITGPIYPNNHSVQLNDFPTNGRNISPPQPNILDYSQGENRGVQRPIYEYEVQKLKWRLNRHSNDTFSSAQKRNFTSFHYKGTFGMEEYIKRVASHEFGISNTRISSEKEGLKAQMIAARTYVLFHWLSNSRGLDNPFSNNYSEILISHTPAFHVHRVDTLNARAKNENTRLVIEEAISDTWGLVITHRGRLISAEYYAGDHTQHTSCPGGQEYIEEVHTKNGVDCAQAVQGSQYSKTYGHGRGMSQNGSKKLSDNNITYLQVIHWYYYGVQVRNNYGLGDIITRTPQTPATDSWLVNANLPDLPQDDVIIQNEYWELNQVIQANSPRNSYLSHNFRSHEFCQDVNNQPISLRVKLELIRKLQILRYKLNSSINVLGVIDTDSVRVEYSHANFRTEAEAEFGVGNVTHQGGNQWDLRV